MSDDRSRSPANRDRPPKVRWARLPLGYGDALRDLSLEARLLYFELSTCRLRDSIPGLLPVGVLGIAEVMNWTPARIRKALGELGTRVLIDDRERMIFVPRCLVVDPPTNEYVLQHWANLLSVLPACTVRTRVIETITSLLPPALCLKWQRRLSEAGLTSPRDRGGDGGGEGGGDREAEGGGASVPSTHVPVPVPLPSPSPAPSARAVENFESLWSQYPKKDDREEALTAYVAVVGEDAELHRKVLASVKARCLDAGWQEEHGRFVPRLAKFLRTRQFDERPRFDDGVPSVEATDRLLRTGRSK